MASGQGSSTPPSRDLYVSDIMRAGDLAAMKEMAEANWDFYQEHLKVGFLPDQAIAMIGAMLNALISTKLMMRNPDESDD